MLGFKQLFLHLPACFPGPPRAAEAPPSADGAAQL